MFFRTLCLLISIHSFPALADTTTPIELDPIYKEGWVGETLNQDPIVPSVSSKTKLNSGTGTLKNSIQQQAPFEWSQYGNRPGVLSQIRGLGKSTEETGVQLIGIPLNPAQGGGFDFSIFPQYLWSDFSFQAGPSQLRLDPLATSGSLTLVPWTETALKYRQAQFRLTHLYSSFGFNQISAAGSSGENIAAVMGYTSGEAHGPSGILSGKLDRGPLKLRYYFLGTQIETQIPGPTSAPTPNARQLTFEFIPAFQAEYQLSSSMTLKSNIYYNGLFRKYDDPGSFSFPYTRDHVLQAGTENALLFENWKFGLSAQRIWFNSATSFGTQRQTENIASAQISRLFEVDSFLVEPMLQATSVSDFSTLPGASLGVRYGLAKDTAVFSRATYSRRFPSLNERYYSTPEFFGNPDLKVEKDWTVLAGAETRNKIWDAGLQGYSQWRKDAAFKGVGPSPENINSARIYALLLNSAIRPNSWFQAKYSFNANDSKLDATNVAFPYLPSLTQILGAEVHDTSDKPLWSFAALGRFSSGYGTSTTQDLPLGGYGMLDLSASAQIYHADMSQIGPNLDLTLALENVFDRVIELPKGYPSPGRVFTASLQGRF